MPLLVISQPCSSKFVDFSKSIRVKNTTKKKRKTRVALIARVTSGDVLKYELINRERRQRRRAEVHASRDPGVFVKVAATAGPAAITCKLEEA